MVGGDPRRIGKIRAPKTVKPRLFDARIPLLYVWSFEALEEAERHARSVCEIAERLYQLGRGVDMAWAWGEVLDECQLDVCLAQHGGVLHQPFDGGAGATLLCPRSGTLKSLEERFKESRERFTVRKEGRKDQKLFSQARKPNLAPIAYNSPTVRLLFDIRRTVSCRDFRS